MTRGEILVLARRYARLSRFIPHFKDMLPKMEVMKDMAKLNRWLGFMQGALWEYGIFKLDQLKAHNKGSKSKPYPRHRERCTMHRDQPLCKNGVCHQCKPKCSHGTKARP